MVEMRETLVWEIHRNKTFSSAKKEWQLQELESAWLVANDFNAGWLSFLNKRCGPVGDTVQEKNVLIVTCSKWYLYYEWIIVTESKLWDSLISMALVGSATCECCSESREKILMLMLLRTCRFCFYIIQIWANTGLFLHNLIYIDQPKLIKCPGGTCGPDTIFKPKLYASRLRQDMNQKWFFCV